MSDTPDWNKIALGMETNLLHDEIDSEWTNETENWLRTVAKKFGSDYRIEETDNFLIMSNESEPYITVFSSFLEKTRKRILETLKGVAKDDGYGKHIVMIFKDNTQYYEYISQYYPEEGEFGLSSGTFINGEYGHFAFPSQEITLAEPIAVHELTHACLSHLPIPLWLNEGIAVQMEAVLAGNDYYIDNEIFAQHQSYWDEDSIQDFWSGESFQAIDEGQELSYHLAHVLIRYISKDYVSFSSFTNNADFEDAGQEAARSHLGLLLENLIVSFLGEGSWEPRV